MNSLTLIFLSAYWLERELWDLFGLYFFEHFRLRRILTDYGFFGYPLRKDFPTSGFLEVRYDEKSQKVLYEQILMACMNRDNTLL
jgi:NADH-quinone oxidoreductase subunit C